MSRRSLSQLLVVGLALLLVLAACQPSPITQPSATQPAAAPAEPGAAEQPAPSADKVKAVLLPYISFAPFFIAQEEGYFQEQGLDVELVNLAQNQDAIAALIGGEVDVSGGLMTAGLLNSIARGANIRLVADKGSIDPEGCANIAMIARQSLLESGAELNADTLRGLSLNNVPGSWNEYYSDKLLATIGLSLEDMNNQYSPSPGQLDSLSQGTLDLTVNNEPWVSRFKAAGHQPILTPVTELLPQSQSAIMTYGPRLLEEDVDVGNRFLAAYLKAVQQYNEGKTDRNVEILLKYMQLDPELLREMCWPTIRADGSLDHASILDFQEWAVGRDLADQTLAIEDIVDERFLDQANQMLGN